MEEEPKELTEEDKKLLAESSPQLMAQAEAAEQAAKDDLTIVPLGEKIVIEAAPSDGQSPDATEDGYEEAYADENEEQ